jgi:hypothetical protein
MKPYLDYKAASLTSLSKLSHWLESTSKMLPLEWLEGWSNATKVLHLEGRA